MLDGPNLLREARKAARLTQAQLAGRLGVGQPEIARLEARGANPRLETLQRAIQATGHALELSLGPSVGIDETMIAEDLQLTPSERLSRFEQLYDFAQRFGGLALRPDGP